MARISIIIPVYNVKDYLSRCLDSVLKQTVKDYECILIDDGSTDGSGSICEKYASEDSRFIVSRSKNSGPSAARNIGLEMVTSPWVTFIDSDDYVDKHYLENFLKYNESDAYTQVIQGYHCMGYDGEDADTLYPGTSYTIQEIVVGERSEYMEEKNLMYNWAVWCKVFSMEIIRKYDIKFDERMFCSQDGIFWHNYLCYVDKLIYVPERGYTYYCPRKFRSVSRGGRYVNNVDSWLTVADNYRQISPVLTRRFCMGRKYSSYIEMFYWHNWFRALLKPRTLTSSQMEMLESIKPSYRTIVLTPKGILYWLINLLPIKFVRTVREIL